MGGGTLAAKVAGKIACERSANASASASENSESADIPAASTNSNADADSPDWIDTAGEDAYLGEQAQAAAFAQSSAPRASDADADADADEDAEDKAAGKDLPPMDALVARIPAETRQALEELFRARFVKVRKFPRKLVEL